MSGVNGDVESRRWLIGDAPARPARPARTATAIEEEEYILEIDSLEKSVGSSFGDDRGRVLIVRDTDLRRMLFSQEKLPAFIFVPYTYHFDDITYMQSWSQYKIRRVLMIRCLSTRVYSPPRRLVKYF